MSKPRYWLAGTLVACCLAISANAQFVTQVVNSVAVGGITGLGTGVATALGIAVGSAGGPVTNGGALGTPSSGVGTNLTGTAAGLTAGNVTGLTTNGTAAVGQLPGTTTNDDAATGKVGEYISSTVVLGSAVTLSTGTAADVTSISLTAGDWDVWIDGYFLTGATTTVGYVLNYISTTTATTDTTPGRFGGAVYAGPTPSVVPGTTAIPANVGPFRLSLAGTTTVFLVAGSAFGVSTMKAYGLIAARRVR